MKVTIWLQSSQSRDFEQFFININISKQQVAQRDDEILCCLTEISITDTVGQKTIPKKYKTKSKPLFRAMHQNFLPMTTSLLRLTCKILRKSYAVFIISETAVDFCKKTETYTQLIILQSHFG